MQRPLFVELAAALLLLYAWLLAASSVLYLPPLAGAGEVLFLGALFAARYLWPSDAPAQIERRARSRARRLGPQWPWAIASAIAVAVFLLGFVSIYSHLVPPTPDPDHVMADFLRQPFAMLPLLLADAVVDPVVEEVIFRGWIQGRLSREFGPEIAIVTAAGIFAAVHLSAWDIPPLFLLGLASGYTVYLTRSIWAGVMMNAAFSLGVDLLDSTALRAGGLSAFSAAPNGVRAVLLVMLGAAVAAILIWHRQRIVRDRIAAAAEPGTGGGSAD